MIEALFDTSIIIDWLRDRSQAAAELERYERHWISRNTWIEVLAGERAPRRAGLIELIERFDVIEIDQQIALDAAELRFTTRLKLPDAIIWATARRNDLLLVTRNSKDFPATTPGVRIPYLVE